MSELRERLVEILRQEGLARSDQPVKLASGDVSRYFIDGKRALASGRNLQLACEAFLEAAAEMEVEFDAAGGLTMGADHLAHGIALLAGVEWFSVRKQQKDRGTKKRIEGADLGPGRQVLLVEDVVTRGGSVAAALQEVRATGATVVAAVALVDRGPFGEELFRREGIPYRAMVTYADLGIPAVGDEPGTTAATA